VHHQDVGLRAEQCDRGKVQLRIEADVLPARGVGGQNAGIAHEQGVAVGRRLRGLFRGDDAAGAGAVLDHQRLTENRS